MPKLNIYHSEDLGDPDILRISKEVTDMMPRVSVSGIVGIKDPETVRVMSIPMTPVQNCSEIVLALSGFQGSSIPVSTEELTAYSQLLLKVNKEEWKQLADATTALKVDVSEQPPIGFTVFPKDSSTGERKESIEWGPVVASE
ncbi:hypothetical protein FWG95_00255 [Candidatus Saccharibacteria bacterium]|nr:hypothetical protein [Candidatus Saccharibacteria bacterium]